MGDMDGTRPCGCNAPSPFQLLMSVLTTAETGTNDLSYEDRNNDKGPGSPLDKTASIRDGVTRHQTGETDRNQGSRR